MWLQNWFAGHLLHQKAFQLHHLRPHHWLLLQVDCKRLLEASAASGANTAIVRGLVHVVGSIIQITSVGITVMNDEIDADFDDTSELDSQPLDDDGLADWDFPSDISQPDCADISFELVTDSTPSNIHLGPSQPLPKLRPQHVGPRPRVAPYRTLHRGAPVVRTPQSSASSHQSMLRVSDLASYSQTAISPQDCPRSIFWPSVDDLEFQQLPPQGRSTPMSLQVIANREFSEPSSDTRLISKIQSAEDKRYSDAFSPPHPQNRGANPDSATALVRTKQPSCNPTIVQLFNTLLYTFGEDSSLGTNLADSSFRDIHLSRVIDGYAASTLMKYMSSVGNFIRTCKEMGHSFLDISALQLADILITVQLSKSSDTAGCSSTSTLKALRWWQKVAGVDK